MNDWLHAAADLLEPLFQALRQQILGSDYLQMDETPIRVLEKEPLAEAKSGSKSEKKSAKKLEKTAGSHRGYFWVCHSPSDRISIFEYDPRRSADLPADLLKDFRGTLQSDGYVVYDFLPGNRAFGWRARKRQQLGRKRHPTSRSWSKKLSFCRKS